jgi:hypothetical protein
MAYFNSNTMDVTSYKGQILSLVENTNFHLKFIYSPLRIGVQSVLPGNEKWVAPLKNRYSRKTILFYSWLCV